MEKEVNPVAEKPVCSSLPNKKSHGKIPKKIHKAEREKLKRDHLNELFLELGNALEPARQNNGKATVLGDATRILQDLLAQVECLKRQNAALLSESHYVTIEKSELREENSALEAEIEKLQSELQERVQCKPAWAAASAPLQNKSSGSHLPEDHHLTLPVLDSTLQPAPVVAPVFVIPVHCDLQVYPEPETVQTCKPPSQVSRPHARYPTPSDSWPAQLLAEQSYAAKEGLLSSKNTTVVRGGEQVAGRV
ncbi:PREDICTED: transcription factor bHLH47-like [Nelumbo nucifera]|uniref:Transcription factor bHLH47-like n=1 Tax=Nelumbo nucifera TaxID=4432 RepID=A0A1U8A9Z9_NELNU|nr:PREDICTED: transcription factor bHLH47-like [Nelumbo nucifera]XP_010258394.1 PREDICTED: transcription factor bHLH47-like [Nelumbo nucifera]